MDQDDPEKRIADLERQLGEQRRGPDLPPVAPDRPQAGSISNSDHAGRRFTVSVLPKTWQVYSIVALFLLGFGGLGFGVLGSTDASPPTTMIMVMVGLGVIYTLGVLWLNSGRKVVICVTTDRLTINKRPGDVFSFRDAQLGQWRGGRPGPYVGRALFLTSGPHRFVLGDFKNPGNASQVPIEGPQVKHQDLDAWTKSSAFDELLAIVGSARGADLEHQLAERQPQANAAHEAGNGGRKPSTGASIVRFFAMFILVGGLFFFGTGALLAYEDSPGTPTTATIDHCVPHVVEEFGNGPPHKEVDYETCYGRWSVGGVSQTGPIRGRFHGDHLVGSQVDVHVRGGTAYERRASSALEIWRMFGGFIAIATGVVLYWCARRKIRTGSWPWSRSVVV
jgi:hypothetical protein